MARTQRQGKTLTRLEINWLHNQGFITALGDLSAQLPELKERLRNQFQKFGGDMVFTGGIGEWAAPVSVNLTTNGGKVWYEAQNWSLRLDGATRTRSARWPNFKA